uniref:Uncharacterized protein n=1 Tax=Neobodo designis TaxID=312471 RepID=A0A7S1KX65_NEODS|mmetsp:Transcript_10407/g.32262  ORF Transcript_10407/g.32262 Transcript_10407/m.32262 type:complete len:231 (+) Transcript_10407:46-738(+)
MPVTPRKAQRVFDAPAPERTWKASATLRSNVYMKRGLGAFWTFVFADFSAQVWARYRRMLIMDAKHDFDGPSAQGHAVKRGLRADWDLWQVLRSALFGAFFYAPLRLRWHHSLDRLFPLTDVLTPPELRATIAKRFMAEHGLFGPSLITFYLMFHSVLEGRELMEAPARAFYATPGAVAMTWGMWIPTQAVCWFALPSYLWPTVTAIMTFVWVTMMADSNRRVRHLFDAV